MITIAQKLGKKECPYLTRWVLDFKLFSIRLHHWHFGDDPRSFHDHPWHFFGIVLIGSYFDLTVSGRENMPTGKVFFRNAHHKHTVETKGCWTLIFTGPEIREWGFWIKNTKGRDVWFKAKRYFLKRGHHECQ